ncbi:hypothetical protein B0T11DRAFT_144028 [Plectosphaerella cucumerina]|uniref:DUF6546 domain-containing protein n=1 Tax=Plectosphaerella cucumerina TaxID=40658 RepID=A0A8K0T4Q7_9PEZI|nr:hypothetical protein B0T11DRAFT_144028 [Plectosphaerella cucumerina]
MTGWHDLPVEIRWMMFDYIKELAQLWPSNDPPYPQLPRVSREWNYHFAHTNFRVLVLDQDRLDDFKKIISNNKSRRKHVESIFLWVKLPEYDCDVCQTAEDYNTSLQNTEIFVQAVHKLFSIMSTWTRPQLRLKKGIALEIGAYSPSDGQHGFRDCRLFKQFPHLATPEMHNSSLLEGQAAASDDADSCPEWLRAQDGKEPLIGSKRRLLATLGPPAVPLWSSRAATDFSACPIFDSLSIQHHCYRHISPVLVQRILKALPRVNFFRGDTWVHPDDSTRSAYHEDLAFIFNDMPKSLRHVILSYETRAPFRPRKSWTSVLPMSQNTLARAIAKYATELKSLSVTYQIDAPGFIEHSLDLARPFNRLEYLELTLPYETSRWSIIILLEKVSRLVFWLMPKLKRLHIWSEFNTQSFHCYLSRTPKGNYRFEWRSTWVPWASIRTLKQDMRWNLLLHQPGKILWVSSLRGHREMKFC